MSKKFFRLSAILFFAILSANSCTQAKKENPLIGTWEYRQANSADPSAYDQEAELLKITRDGENLKAEYNGISREEEHGLFFYTVQINDLQVDKNDELSFSIAERVLYSARESVGKQEEKAGTTKDTLTLKGKIESDTLILECQSEQNSCPEKTMKFQKKSTAQ